MVQGSGGGLCAGMEGAPKGSQTLAHSLALGNKILLQADLGASLRLDLLSDLGLVTPACCLIVSFFICKREGGGEGHLPHRLL